MSLWRSDVKKLNKAPVPSIEVHASYALWLSIKFSISLMTHMNGLEETIILMDAEKIQESQYALFILNIKKLK